MKPNRLLVSKFLGIESLDLVFENDLFVIVGPNGSGKSSILEALFFALYGKSVRAGGKGSLIHRGYPESSLRTELEFTLASHSYRVTREYSLKRGSTASLEERTGERWTTICSGDRGVNQKIEHLLGLDAETYEASVFLPQGETLSFVESTPSGRFAVLSNLFGLGILDTIREQSKSRLDVLEGRLHQLDEQRRVLTDASLEEKLSTAMGQKESLDKKIAECSRVEKETTSLLKGLETLHHSRTELLSTGIKIKNLLPEIERAKKQAEIDRDIQNALFVKATYWQPWETVLEKLTTLQTRNQRTREKKDALFLALNENSRHLQKTVENEKTLRDKLKTLEDYHYQLDTIVRPEVSTLLMLVRDRETWTKEKNRDEVILTGIRKTIEEEKKAWQVLNY
ncbi:MAG: SMC family ATPase, partial [Candidatus Atribacteria bacterium]|nr:SMC family ATPase [Candidatus Atribacteria bacterium]